MTRLLLGALAVLAACATGWLAVDGYRAAATMTMCFALLAGCEALEPDGRER